MDMVDPTGLRHGFVPTGSSLIKMPLERQDCAEEREYVRVGIKRNGLDTVMYRANKVNTSLQDGAGSGEVTEVEANSSLVSAAQNLRGHIVPRPSNLVELFT